MLRLAFVLTVVAEIVVFVLVAHQIGVLAAVGLLVLVSFLGGVLVKSQGARALRGARRELRNDRIPARQAIDGILLLFAGGLLAFPGFLTGILGLLLVLPPTRAAVRVLAVRRGSQRLRNSLDWFTVGRSPFGARRGDVRGPVVDAGAWEDPESTHSSPDRHRAALPASGSRAGRGSA